MPLIARLFIKCGLIYFVAALLLALVLSTRHHVALPPYLSAMGTTQLHLFMVGWVTQIIFGVAIWFFPRYSRDKPRGRDWLNYTAFITLNLGLLLRLVTEPLQATDPSPLITHAMVGSALLQWLASLAFAVNIWPRLRPQKSTR
jgi:hypothetical protein